MRCGVFESGWGELRSDNYYTAKKAASMATAIVSTT